MLARCGQCKQRCSRRLAPLEVGSTADFDQLVSRSAVPVIVDLLGTVVRAVPHGRAGTGEGRSSCRGRYMVVKVNTDALDDLGARHGIRSIPTLAVFREDAR